MRVLRPECRPRRLQHTTQQLPLLLAACRTASLRRSTSTTSTVASSLSRPNLAGARSEVRVAAASQPGLRPAPVTRRWPHAIRAALEPSVRPLGRHGRAAMSVAPCERMTRASHADPWWMTCAPEPAPRAIVKRRSSGSGMQERAWGNAEHFVHFEPEVP